MTLSALFEGPWLGVVIDLVFVVIGLMFCGLAGLGLIGPRVAEWRRTRRDSGEVRMWRAHAEWVRRIGHVTFDVSRPARPRRAPTRAANGRPAPLFPPMSAAPKRPPNRRGKPRPPPVFVPFPDRTR